MKDCLSAHNTFEHPILKTSNIPFILSFRTANSQEFRMPERALNKLEQETLVIRSQWADQDTLEIVGCQEYGLIQGGENRHSKFSKLFSDMKPRCTQQKPKGCLNMAAYVFNCMSIHSWTPPALSILFSGSCLMQKAHEGYISGHI
jgi:hypothetical protein